MATLNFDLPVGSWFEVVQAGSTAKPHIYYVNKISQICTFITTPAESLIGFPLEGGKILFFTADQTQKVYIRAQHEGTILVLDDAVT